MICSLFKQIIGFKDKKESDFFRINNTERDWSEYTTIGLGIEFARRNPCTKYLVESMNYNCVIRGQKNINAEKLVIKKL